VTVYFSKCQTKYSISDLITRAIMDRDHDGPLCDLFFFFLSNLFRAHAEEEESFENILVEAGDKGWKYNVNSFVATSHDCEDHFIFCAVWFLRRVVNLPLRGCLIADRRRISAW